MVDMNTSPSVMSFRHRNIDGLSMLEAVEGEAMPTRVDTDDFHFLGFAHPNGTFVPDEVFDVLMPRLSEPELRVLLYIVRRTFGFKKSSDDISLKQMAEGIRRADGTPLDHGTGLSRPAVTKGVRGLVEKGIILAERNRSDERGDRPSTYTLRFVTETQATTTEEGGGVNDVTTGGKPRYEGGVNAVTRGGVNAVTSQDTVFTTHRDTREKISNTSKEHFVDNFVDNPGDNSPATPVLIGESATSELSDESHTGYRRKRPQLPPDELVPLTRLMEDLSVEFGDRDHTQSNVSQAMNLMVQAGLSVSEFFGIAYDVRTSVRQSGSVRNRMAFFFSMLRRELRIDKFPASSAIPGAER